MTITVVADVLGAPNNGTTIAAFNLIRALTEKGHSVRVICPDKEKANEEGYYIVPTLQFGPFQPIVDHNGVVLAKGDAMTIERALRDADEAHIMMPFAVGRKTVRIANRLGIPVSAGFHAQAENVTAHFFNLMSSRTANRLVYLDFWHRFYQYVDAIHYPSQFIRDTFEKAIGRPTNGYVISNGVSPTFHHIEVERPEELRNRIVLISTGRYSKEKRQDLLLKAAAISAHKSDIQIILAGEGPREKRLRKEANRLGVRAIFRFFERDELVKALNMADLYVHTAVAEIEAISCLEAMSCGLVPVINDSSSSATRYFALAPESLFRANDPRDLAKKIDYWIEHPDEKAKMAIRYAAYGGRFDFNHCMDEMEAMIVATSQIAKKPSFGR
jgi:glycosyltransferase involved in cell wall biosynthesis